MKTWLLNLWDNFRTGFWFLPAIFLLVAAVVAIALPETDAYLAGDHPEWLLTSKETARSTLTTLTGAMFTVASIVFSTTIVAVSITSSQLGPRLLRSFTEQMVSQIVIGLCLATCLYCLLVLRAVDRVDDSVFVPHISVAVATLLSVITLAAVVYFIHRVCAFAQPTRVVEQLAEDLSSAMNRLFPESIGSEGSRSPAAEYTQDWDELLEEKSQDVLSEREGYLQAIDSEGLMEAACEHNLLVRLNCQPGDFLHAKRVVAEVHCQGDCDQEVLQALAECFIVGTNRTPRQDFECAINELVEIALRALSPGINDAFTAINCVDRLGGCLRQLATRSFPSGARLDDQGRLRCLAKPYRFSKALDASFDQIRQSSAGNIAVTIRLLETLQRIGEVLESEADRKAVMRQAEAIIESSRSRDIVERDIQDIENRFHQLQLTIHRSMPTGKSPKELISVND